MSIVKGPDFIALQVHDLEESKKFYTEIIGLEVAPNAPPEAVLFITSPIPFAIRTPHVNLDGVSQLGHGIALWFLCDNSVELYEHLKKNGVKVLTKPAPGPFGMFFQFKDPDGYIITVHDKA